MSEQINIYERGIYMGGSRSLIKVTWGIGVFVSSPQFPAALLCVAWGKPTIGDPSLLNCP